MHHFSCKVPCGIIDRLIPTTSIMPEIGIPWTSVAEQSACARPSQTSLTRSFPLGNAKREFSRGTNPPLSRYISRQMTVKQWRLHAWGWGEHYIVDLKIELQMGRFSESLRRIPAESAIWMWLEGVMVVADSLVMVPEATTIQHSLYSVTSDWLFEASHLSEPENLTHSPTPSLSLGYYRGDRNVR